MDQNIVNVRVLAATMPALLHRGKPANLPQRRAGPAERRARDRLMKKQALREVVTSPFESLDDTGVAAFLHHKQVMEAQNSLF